MKSNDNWTKSSRRLGSSVVIVITTSSEV